jgi:hypothetical protein
MVEGGSGQKSFRSGDKTITIEIHQNSLLSEKDFADHELVRVANKLRPRAPFASFCLVRTLIDALNQNAWAGRSSDDFSMLISAES